MARGKKSWRKKKAVLEEQYLVDRQDDALLGSLTETADKDLFLIDRGGNRQSSSQVSSASERKRKAREATPFYEKLIMQGTTAGIIDGFVNTARSHQQPPSRKKRTEKSVLPNAQSPMQVPGEQKPKLSRDPVTNRKIARQWETDSELFSKTITAPVAAGDHDLWGGPLRSTKPKRVHIMPGKSQLPDPGQSYRPDQAEHQVVLASALSQLTHLQDKEKKLEKFLAFPQELKSLPSEMVVDVGQKDEAQAFSLGEEPYQIPIHEEKCRVTKKERKKRQRQRAHTLRLMKESRKKTLKRTGDRTDIILKGIKRKELHTKIRQQKKVASRKKLDLIPSMISHRKYSAPMKDFVLTEDIPRSLLAIQPTGNQMMDMFKKFQSRNMIEPRLPTKMRRKYQPKIFEKPSVRFGTTV